LAGTFESIRDRPAMVTGGVILALGTALGPLAGSLPALMALWAVLGFGYSLTQTPSGRLLRRSAQPEDRPAIFAAQFALSHACWLLTYPLAGRLGAAFGLDETFLVMGGLAALGVVLALRLWPARETGEILHAHPDLPPDHPHLREHGAAGHRHAVVIDDLHHRWPRPGHGVA
jgi:MFS family permease